MAHPGCTEQGLLGNVVEGWCSETMRIKVEEMNSHMMILDRPPH